MRTQSLKRPPAPLRAAACLAACLLALLHPAPAAQAAVLDRIAAVVNNEVITLSEVQEEGLPEIQKVVRDYVEAEQEAQLAKVYQKFLDQLIVRRLQMQEARKEQVIPAAGEVSATIKDLMTKNNFKTEEELRRVLLTEGLTMESFRRRVTEQLALGRITLKEVRNKIIVEERDIRQYYEANRDKFKRTPEVTIRHILVALPARASLEGPVQARARAEEALAKLKSGADFAEVAKTYSDGPTAQTGGLLGTMQRGDLAPEIEEQAFTLPIGEVSGIIQTATGLNIIKVESRKDEPVAPLEEVRDKVREAILDQKYSAKHQEWIAELKRKASIQVRVRDGKDQARTP